MATIALNMIAKNEAPRIGAALDSAAKVCDELIVVDTGSDDGTPAIARGAGTDVAAFDWCDDYAAARNYALDLTTADWILVLDADDVLDDHAVELIRLLKRTLDHVEGCDGVFMNYLYEWDGDRCTKQFPIQRLIRRASGLRWSEPAHELVDFPDRSRVMLRLDIDVTHRPHGKDRSDRTMQLRALKGAIDRGTATPRTWFNYASELRNTGQLEEAIVAFRQYVDTRDESVPGGRYHAMVSVAACHVALGRSYDAVRAATSAMLTDPSRAEAFALIGELEFKRRHYEAAIPLFAAAVHATMPQEGIVQGELYSWLSHERLASCYIRLGEHAKAVEHATAALENHPRAETLTRFLQPQ
jgi:tetratricopeptide (TPR) repeat protein